MKYSFLKSGEAVFHIDSVGDKFYLTLKGKVGVYIRLPKPQKKPEEEQNEENKKDQNELTCVKELEQGFAFGELALLNNKPRLATIMCHQDCHFMTLDKRSFILILKQKEEERLFKEMGFFAKLPFFEGWNHNLIKLIYLNSFRIKYRKNECIFQEGEEPASVYIVTEGEFVIQKGFDRIEMEDEFGFKQTQIVNHLRKEITKQKKQIQLAVLVLNEMFGEEDIMSKSKSRTYSAYCSTSKGECIVVKKRDFLIRIMHEEGARMYLEQRLVQKNQYMKEKIQKIQGSIADYQNYIYDDCSEQKQKLQISNAISKIESPKKRQKSQVSFVDFSSIENKDDNLSPSRENQTFTNNILFDDKSISSPMMRKQESQSPKNMKRGLSVMAVGGQPSISKMQIINNTQAEEKNAYLQLQSSVQKSRTIIELDKVESQQNKEIQMRKSFTNLDSQTPWRDTIAKDYSKNISDTFKNIFSFQLDVEKKQQTCNQLQIPGESSSPKRRNSKLIYSQTLVIPHSSTELGGGFSPIQKRNIGDEIGSPNFKKQLSQIRTPVVATPLNNFQDTSKAKQCYNTDTFSSSIKKLNNILSPKNNKQKNNDQICTFSIIENSLNYTKNNLTSPANKIDITGIENQKQFPKFILNMEQQIQQQKINEQSPTQFSIIKLRKSQENITVLEEGSGQNELACQQSKDSQLIIENKVGYLDKSLIGKEADKSQLSPLENKKQILFQNIFQNQQKNYNFSNELKDNHKLYQQPLLLNLKLINQESNEHKLQQKFTKNIESLCQIDDDTSSQQNSEDMNKTLNSQKRQNVQTSQKEQINQLKNRQILLNQTSNVSQLWDRQRSQDSIKGVNLSMNSQQEGKKLNLKLKDRVQQNLIQKISNLQSEYNKITSANTLDSQQKLEDKGYYSNLELINKNLNEKQEGHQHVDFMIKQVPQISKFIHQNNGEDTTQNLLNDFNQKLLVKKKIFYNSSFSPMKGRINEHKPYKFEQYKDNYHIKKQSHIMRNTSQNATQFDHLEQDLNNSMKIIAARENVQLQLKELENKQNEIVASSYFVQTKPRSSEKQIISFQKLGHMMRQRKYNRSIDFQNDDKQNLSIGFNNYVNQSVNARFNKSNDSVSHSPEERLIRQNLNQSKSQRNSQPTLQYSDNLNQIKSQRIRKSQTLKIHQINEKQQENQNDQITTSNQKGQTISKQQPLVRTSSFSPEKIQTQQKQSITQGDQVNASNNLKQKRFSAIRKFNKSEQQLGKSIESAQSNHHLEMKGAVTHDQSNNHTPKVQHHTQNQSFSQKLQPTIINYQNIKQIITPASYLDAQPSQNTNKQTTLQEKMRQQIQSSQNLSRSSINNPYTNLNLIQQHQQLHKSFSKNPQLIQKTAQQNQKLNMKNQSSHQL